MSAGGWRVKTYTARHEFPCLCGALVMPGDRLGYVHPSRMPRARAVHYRCALAALAAVELRPLPVVSRHRAVAREGSTCASCGRTFAAGEPIDLIARRVGGRRAPVCAGSECLPREVTIER